MKPLIKKDDPFRADTLHWTGIMSIIVSASFLFVDDLLAIKNPEFNSFIICYGITAIYSFAVLARTLTRYRWRLAKGPLHHTALMLVLWFISAFSLNKEMNIFENSGPWLSVAVFLASLALIAATFHERLPRFIKGVLAFMLGAATLLFSYYAVYLIPFYLIGGLSAILIGVSLHVFIPLFLLIVSMIFILRMQRSTSGLGYMAALGAGLPVILLIAFICQWNQLHGRVKSIQNNYTLRENELPEWVAIAQELPSTLITEKFLKAGLVYSIPTSNGNWFWGNIGGSGFEEARKHDPLVVIASVFCGTASIGDDDRIKILKSIYNSRHLAQERLWSGDHLATSNVVTNIKVYPEYRMAYTEKTISIENLTTSRWTRDEEAIYTFHLPEGSVASSLSLWINGLEEKSRVTTKGKADSAYKAIVGVEARDPSVLHWQEGNTVTVRVFPCNKKEKRKFRIGVTSPLKAENGRLYMENPWFEGPSPANASEVIQLTFSNPPKALDTDLKIQENGTYKREGNYLDRWNISFAEEAISTQPFSFAGSSYRLRKSMNSKVGFKPESVYLDINGSWSREDLDALWPEIKKMKVYVYNEQLIRLTEHNLDRQYEMLLNRNFSLFPLYKISSPGTSLLISKSNERSPNLGDLERSSFQKRSSAYLINAERVHLYNIGESLSPYLKTLKEFNSFRYMQGSCNTLVQQLQKQQWLETTAQSNVLDIPGSGMSIEQLTAVQKGTAPDHLLRLFAYNDILKKVGKTYFERDYIQDNLLKTADQAFIVSPVSSLIVLEKKDDYERFGIDESKDSLKNASIQSSGAAPEPQEWILIILFTTIMGYFLYRSDYHNQLKTLWKH